MISNAFEGVGIGYQDLNGDEIHVGDTVKTTNGHRGTVTFGIYGGGHYGVHIRWEGSDGNADPNALRQDFIYWSDKITKCP